MQLKVHFINVHIILHHPWSSSNLWEAASSNITFWNSLGPSRKALYFIILEFVGRHKHIPDVFRDCWWLCSFSRPSFGHLSQRCWSTLQVGGNQAGAKKAASPSGGLRISRGQTFGVTSAQRSRSRGWGLSSLSCLLLFYSEPNSSFLLFCFLGYKKSKIVCSSQTHPRKEVWSPLIPSYQPNTIKTWDRSVNLYFSLQLPFGLL